MSTFLQLCQATSLECGVAGGDTVPSAVTNQTGELDRIVSWVKNAWVEIQNRNNSNWRWMRVGFTVNTVADDDSYAYTDCTDALTSIAIARFKRWRFTDSHDPAKIYLTSSGVGTQTWLTYLDWDDFKAIYRIGTQNSGFPAHISIDPQNKLVLGPKPNGIYTVTGDFVRSAQVLAADATEPEMPSDFHNLIVYEAMQRYGYFESAPEVLSRGKELAGPLRRQLELDQLPMMRLRGPMA